MAGIEENPTGTFRRAHALVEHYTPDSTVGRFALSSVTGTVSFFSFVFGLVGLIGFSLFWLPFMLGLLATSVAFGVLTIATLWPVYLSLIGNVDSPTAYAKRGGEAPPERLGDSDPAQRLKREYADGNLTDEEFERRLNNLIDADEYTVDVDSSSTADVPPEPGRVAETE